MFLGNELIRHDDPVVIAPGPDYAHVSAPGFGVRYPGYARYSLRTFRAGPAKCS